MAMAAPVTRKRKAPTLRAEDWEPYKARIVELHVTQDLPLKDVKAKLEQETGFHAEIRQYRLRISQWKLDKNVKPQEMKAIVRKRQQRRLEEVGKGDLFFTVRGNEVEPHKIDRWMKNNDVLPRLPYEPSESASTPSDVFCRTISEVGSPFHSPMNRTASAIMSPRPTSSRASTAQLLSPALSISSIIRPPSVAFVGQSPALAHRPLPGLLQNSFPVTGVVENQIHVEGSVSHYRYRQMEEERLRQELATAEAIWGTTHPGTLHIKLNLAFILVSQGRLKAAEQFVRRLLTECHQTYGKAHVHTLKAYHGLGVVYEKQGLHHASERTFQHVLAVGKNLLEDHPYLIILTRMDLGWLYSQMGRLKEAEELLVPLVEACRYTFGEEHSYALICIRFLSVVYRRQIRYNEAEELLVPLLETTIRLFGNEHADTLATMGVLAGVVSDSGRFQEAENLLSRLLDLSSRVFGWEHPDTLSNLHQLALTRARRGRVAEAISIMQYCSQRQLKILGPQHPETIRSLNSLTQMETEHWSTQTQTNLGPNVAFPVPTSLPLAWNI